MEEVGQFGGIWITIWYPESSGIFGQQLVARRDSGEIEFYYRRISGVKQCKPFSTANQKNLNFFRIPQTLPWQPTTKKEPEDSGFETGAIKENQIHNQRFS